MMGLLLQPPRSQGQSCRDVPGCDIRARIASAGGGFRVIRRVFARLRLGSRFRGVYHGLTTVCVVGLTTAPCAVAAQLGGPPSTPGQRGPAFTYHGIVQTDPQVVLVFWGYSASEAPLVAAETDLFGARLPHSAYAGVLAQYGVHDDERLVGVFRDPGFPGWRLRRGDFQREAVHARRALGVVNSPDVQWIVFAPPGADASNFPGECGEHGQFLSAGRSFVYSIVWSYQQDGCGGSVGDETASSSHEWAEAATNPFLQHNKGWWIKLGRHDLQEIADICDWQLVRPWGLSGPTVQALWSNASEGPGRDRGCVERASGGAPSTGNGDPA